VIAKLGKANLVKAKADITAISDAVTSFAIENGGRFPDSLEVLVTPDPNGHTYLDADVVPKDPWGNEYVLEPAPSGSQKFRVISYGKDGVPGGEGDDADIDNIKIKNQEL
jgi:general secretion pathway protein G